VTPLGGEAHVATPAASPAPMETSTKVLRSAKNRRVMFSLLE
jgi:hypothetical protein